MPDAHLELAKQALADGDRVAALDALLGAWRACRAPQLATLIDVVSKDAARATEPLDPSDKRAYDRAWSDLEGRRRAVDIAHLLPGLWGEPKGSIALRVRALLGRGADPRVGNGLLHMIETPPMTASSKFSTWTKLFKALPDYVDSSALKLLNKRAKKHDGTSQFWPKLTSWIEAAIVKLPKPASLSDDAKLKVTALAAVAKSLAAGPPPEIDDTAAAPAVAIAADKALAVAAEQLSVGKLEQTLEALREFWAIRRSASVANLVDQLGALVDRTRPRLDQGKDKEIHARWMAAATTPTAAEVGRLLETLPKGKLVDIEERLAAMSRWTPDPRIATTMFRFIDDPMIGGRELLWAVVYEQLRVHADARIKDRYVANCEALAEQGGWDRAAAENAGMRRARDATVAAFELATELSHAETKVVDKLGKVVAQIASERAAARSSTEQMIASFIDAIVADLEADGPRLVFADWLTENSDPTGEFIALSVALANGKRVRGKQSKYYKKHKRVILGPLESVLASYGNAEPHQRGFLHKVNVERGEAAFNIPESKLVALFRDWRWTTIEQLDTGINEAYTRTILEHAPLRSLRHLSSVRFSDLLAIQMPIPLQSVVITSDAEETVDWTEFDRVTAEMLPALRVAEYRGWNGKQPPPAEFFTTQLSNRLKELTLGAYNSGGELPIDAWAERLYESTSKIPRTTLMRSQLRCVLELTDKRKKRTLTLMFGKGLGVRSADWPPLLSTLQRISKRVVAKTVCGFEHDDDDERPAVLLAALAHLKPTTVPYSNPD